MKNNKTRKIVMAAILAALGMVFGVLEIPYPFAPWLNFDLSEVVVLVAVNMLGVGYAIFVIVCKFFISIAFKGPVGPIAIGQITAMLASISIAVSYYYLSRIIKTKKNWLNQFLSLLLTMTIFAFVMYIVNYYFVTPTYIMNQPTWYSELPFTLDIAAFNATYGTSLEVPAFLSFLSPYGQAIFFIYFPFNFLKGILTAIVYSFIQPVEKRYHNLIKKN